MIPQVRPHPELVTRPQDIQKHANLVTLCKDVGDHLNRMYPGWMWAIQIFDEWHEAISIKNLMLSNRYGHVLHTNGILTRKAVLQSAMRAGGDVLERFGQPRGRCHEDWETRSKWDAGGEAIPLEGPKRRLVI